MSQNESDDPVQLLSLCELNSEISFNFETPRNYF